MVDDILVLSMAIFWEALGQLATGRHQLGRGIQAPSWAPGQCFPHLHRRQLQPGPLEHSAVLSMGVMKQRMASLICVGCSFFFLTWANDLLWTGVSLTGNVTLTSAIILPVHA